MVGVGGAMKTIDVIDADSHVMEVPETWDCIYHALILDSQLVNQTNEET